MKRYEALESLIDEVRLNMHLIVQVGERLHAGEAISLGMRGVLEYLMRNGDSTVPNIARSRHVTRQHIQSLVNSLLEQSWVELVENPAHRRSSLVSLTRKGERMIQKLRDAERRLFDTMSVTATVAELDAAARTLRAVRSALADR